MSGAAKGSVVAVVVTYNRRALLAQTLRAVRAQTRAVERVVVVDNASTDGTRAFVRAEHPGAELIALPENSGGAGGFAAGIEAALAHGPAWVWVMDDDVEPAPDALEALLATPHARDAKTAALTSLKVTPSGAIQHEHAGRYRPARMMPEPLRRVGEEPVEIGYSSFVSLCVRASAARAAGPPRADFFLWYDDVEYSLRLRQQGVLVLVPASRVVHHNVARAAPETPTSAWRSYYALRNRLLILRTTYVTAPERAAGLAVGAFYFARRIGKVLLAERYKRAKLGYAWRAFSDGTRGRSGARVLP